MDSLPNELIAIIVNNVRVTIEDLKMLRLSCKLLSAFATERLAKRYIGHIHVRFNTESLERFSNLCAHPQLGRYVYRARVWYDDRDDDREQGRDVKLGLAWSSIRAIDLDPALWEDTENFLPSVIEILRQSTELRELHILQRDFRYLISIDPRDPNYLRADPLNHEIFQIGDKILHSIVSSQLRNLNIKHLAVSSAA